MPKGLFPTTLMATSSLINPSHGLNSLAQLQCAFGAEVAAVIDQALVSLGWLESIESEHVVAPEF